MPTFRYMAQTQQGQTTSGTVEAETAHAAAATLRAQGYFVTQITLDRAAAARAAPGWFVTTVWDPIFYRVKLRDMAFLFSELHHCVDAGMTPYNAVKLISERMRNRKLRYALTEMSEGLSRGEPLSSEMARFPTIFTDIMRNMVLAGEKSGDLSGVLAQVAEHLEYEHELRRKLSLQTFYPKLLLAAALLIPSVVTWVNGGAAAWLRQVGAYAGGLGLVLILWGVLRIVLQNEHFARLWDEIKLAIPLIGTTVRRFAAAKFARSFASLYRAGLPMDVSVELSAKGCGNRLIRDRCLEMIPHIMSGMPPADALQQTGQFPEHVIHMVHAGQVTGDLDKLLNKVAKFMEAEADAAAQRMAIAILPISVILIGILVAVQLVAFYQGYFDGLLNMS